MGRYFISIAAISILALSGCARLGPGVPQPQYGGGLDATLPPPVSSGTQSQTPDAQVSSLNAAQVASTTNISTFVDAGTVAKLSAKERSEAASAQYYALQFGRPGAPRSWQGDTGASGSVEVGPYVRVNTLDCREYTHKITISGQTHTSSGMACRDANGNWKVASS